MSTDIKENLKKDTNIHGAIGQEDVNHLRRLLADGVDVEEKDGNVTPLMKAVLKDNLEMVNILLAAGADVNAMCHVDYLERFVTLKNPLSLEIVRLVNDHGLTLTPVRHQIIKRLIAAGSDLDGDRQFQHMYSSPIQNALIGRLWPVVGDLIEGGCKLDFKGPCDMTPLVIAVSLNDEFDGGDCQLTWASRRKALGLLLEKSPTLRVKAKGVSLLKRVINGSSARVLCVLLKADKPAYGIDEAVDVLDNVTRNYVVSFTQKTNAILDDNMLLIGRMCCPLESSIVRLIILMSARGYAGYWENTGQIRHQFVILRLLLDARVIASRLDENFKQLIKLIRYRLNKDNIDENILEFGNQVLDAVESESSNPRRLIELCRTRVRHELNIRGLCVHDIRSKVGMIEKYLLYGDVPEPGEYMRSR